MKVLGLDPGTTQSAVVVYDTQTRTVELALMAVNGAILLGLAGIASESPLKRYANFQMPCDNAVLVIEKIEAMGMAVGAEVFETVHWAGRFYQAWPRRVERVSRRDVKLHLCGSMRAKDANVRQALIDKLGKPGTKKQPGPTYGVSSHAWAALAVAVTWADNQCLAASGEERGR